MTDPPAPHFTDCSQPAKNIFNPSIFWGNLSNWIYFCLASPLQSYMTNRPELRELILRRSNLIMAARTIATLTFHFGIERGHISWSPLNPSDMYPNTSLTVVDPSTYILSTKYPMMSNTAGPMTPRCLGPRHYCINAPFLYCITEIAIVAQFCHCLKVMMQRNNILTTSKI